MKNIAIIGVGSFGYNLAISLASEKVDVLVIDIDQNKVDRLKDYVSKAVIADASQKEAIKEIGIADFDSIIISLGDRLDVSIMTILFLKELNAKHIIAKANNEDHGRAMKLVGADEIIFPEKDIAVRLSKTLVHGDVMDYFAFSDDHDVMEVAVPDSFFGKNLLELDIRRKFKLNIIAIKNPMRPKMEIIIPPDYVFQPDDSIVVIGETTKLNEFQTFSRK